MINSKAIVQTVMCGLVAMGISVNVPAEETQKASANSEKCYGVVKAGKNDCQTAATSCAGTSKQDSQKDAWIYLPKGTCEKLVGGSSKHNV